MELMVAPSESPKHNPLSRLMNSISSYDSNIMLAAIISLLLVILFVLLLHIYAQWFLAQGRQRRRRSSSMSLSHVLGPSRFRHFHAVNVDTTLSSSPSKGLDKSFISSIPLFVYKAEEHKQGLEECIICLSVFVDNEVGRRLEKCGHSFHVECIDMWLYSHSNCPICRAPAASDFANDIKSVEEDGGDQSIVRGLSDEESRLEIVIDVPHSENENGNSVLNCDSLSESSSSSLSSCSSLGCSLKRMLSRNRSETKVFQSSTTELEA